MAISRFGRVSAATGNGEFLGDGRSKRTCELTSSIVPRGTPYHHAVELEFPPIGFEAPASWFAACGMNSTRQRGFGLLTTSFTSFNSTVTLGGSRTSPRQARATPHEDECALDAALGWWLRAFMRSGDTMGIPLQIPPLLDAILTLSAMLGLFVYV